MGDAMKAAQAEKEVELYNTTGDYYGDRISIVEGGAVRLHTAKRTVTLPSIVAWVDMYLKIAALEAELAALKGRATQGNRELAEQFVLWSGGSISLHYDTMREAESKIATHAASRLAPVQAELETAVGLLLEAATWRDHAISTCVDGDRAAETFGTKQDSAKLCRETFDAIDAFLTRHQRDNAQGEG